MTKLTVDVEQALAAVPYLRSLPRSELRSLATLCGVTRLARGDAVFHEGDAPTGAFLIVAGRIKVVRSSVDGREQVLHEEGPMATLGEVPVFDGQGFLGSAVAVEDSVVVSIPRTALLAAFNRNPETATAVIRVLAARLRKLAALADLSLWAVRERTAGYLLRESNQASRLTWRLTRTREELAAHLGTVREQVSRALSEFKRARIIELDGRRVTILDPAKLRAVAGSRD